MDQPTRVATPLMNVAERCCPLGQCAYTPSRVRAVLRVIRVARERGEDPGELASTMLGSKGDGRSPGASAGSDTTRHAGAVWDVQQAIKAIGGRPSPEAISDRICPFGADDES
jgi:hypothetical protein